MKNRRGFLLGETVLKIVIAVICIGFLIYFLIALYFNNADAKDLEFAKESLDYMIGEIDAGRNQVEIFNPKGWNLISWRGKDIPLSCENVGWETCLCICDGDWKFWTDKLEECDNFGTCLESEFTVEDWIAFKNPPLKLNIDYENKIIK